MQNAELLIVEAGGTYNYHWALKDKFHSWAIFEIIRID
jgi:hypothetical protein